MGGHSNNSVVHMHDQRNRKKGLFFEARRDSHESRLGVKMYLFSRKRVLMDSMKRCLGVIFQTPPNMSSKKACLGKFGGKIEQNARLGAFFLERENRD